MGSGNPGDKPGYAFFKPTGDAANDTTAINALADQGYRIVEYQPLVIEQAGLLLLSNYDSKE